MGVAAAVGLGVWVVIGMGVSGAGEFVGFGVCCRASTTLGIASATGVGVTAATDDGAGVAAAADDGTVVAAGADDGAVIAAAADDGAGVAAGTGVRLFLLQAHSVNAAASTSRAQSTFLLIENRPLD